MKILGIFAGFKLVLATILLLLVISGCNLNNPLGQEPVNIIEDQPVEDLNTEEIDETLQDLDISDLEDLESELDDLDW